MERIKMDKIVAERKPQLHQILKLPRYERTVTVDKLQVLNSFRLETCSGIATFLKLSHHQLQDIQLMLLKNLQ